MIEYAYTINSPDGITEHRRLNLKLFCIRLKDRAYNLVKPCWLIFYGISVKQDEGDWFMLDGKYNWGSAKRIEMYRESRKAKLKVIWK